VGLRDFNDAGVVSVARITLVSTKPLGRRSLRIRNPAAPEVESRSDGGGNSVSFSLSMFPL
jgi:hypothetical protein